MYLYKESNWNILCTDKGRSREDDNENRVGGAGLREEKQEAI